MEGKPRLQKLDSATHRGWNIRIIKEGERAHYTSRLDHDTSRLDHRADCIPSLLYNMVSNPRIELGFHYSGGGFRNDQPRPQKLRYLPHPPTPSTGCDDRRGPRTPRTDPRFKIRWVLFSPMLPPVLRRIGIFSL